ncbi:sialidase family protein [Paenibacillus sepulcri]|uniref:Glycoside hydrolase n=1 Tax=Paenibacillus sepulcri TaxID=359917 RepID=A0ABS7C0A8_9BACL|nr:glycoside hydrolase [Paenibacillus sepulcri]
MKLPVWKEELPYPQPSEMPYPSGMTRILAHDGRRDLLPFLHDCTITSHGGKLYLGWYNSTDAEICGSSLIRGRYSEDGGESWSEVFNVVGEIGSAEEHFVPASFFVHEDKLFSLITEMGGKNLSISLDLFEAPQSSLDDWRRISVISGGFLSNSPPILMDTGDYIAGVWMPLKGETPAFPAVLISQGSDIAKPWRCSFLYDPLAPGAVKIRCPEITLVVQGSTVTAYVRNDEGKHGDPTSGASFVFTSGDYGESWSKPAKITMPVGNCKMFAGILSDGRRYMIYNNDQGYFKRGLLCMALTEPGEVEYTKVYKLFEGGAAEFDGRGGIWFYPCACEQEGFLYIACTMQEHDGVRSAVIAKIPLDSM